MGIVLALLVGYGMGAKAGDEGLEELFAAVKSIRQSEEFKAAIKALRSHADHALRQIAELVNETETLELGDLVERVRAMAQ